MLGSISAPDPQTAMGLRRRYLAPIFAGLRSADPPLPGPAPTDADVRPGGPLGGSGR
jgi:hypothetical protein